MRQHLSALALGLALLSCAQVAHAQHEGREPTGAAAPGPSQGELIAQAALAASHTDPAKWDWPPAASPDVRQQIIDGRYNAEELRNIFITLARSSGPTWSFNGQKSANPSLAAITAPDMIMHGRGFRGLEAFYGKNGYTGGVSDRVNKVDTLIAHGDRIYISWIIEGKHTGTLFGFPPDGKTIEVRESSMSRFKDGKLAEITDIGDDFGLYTQAGGKVSFPDKP